MTVKAPVVHVGNWGRGRSGKTTNVKALIDGQPRVVVFDLMDEYGDVIGARADQLRGVLEAVKAGWRDGFRVRYVPSRDADLIAALDCLARLVRDIQQPYMERKDARQVVLVVDELAASFPNRNHYGNAFADLCSRGGHYGVNVIGTSQRPAEVATTFRGNTTLDYYFALSDHVDIEAVAKKIGPEHARRLRAFSFDQYLKFIAGEVTEGRNQA